tara:strand:- start:22903 stop:23226 length:324 start_codon:yes stop_codon:yes gene_type:complete
MSVNVSHNNFTDATTLFTNLAAANAMLDNLTVPDATTSTDGVVKKAAASADIATVGGSSVGATATTGVSFSVSGTNPSEAEVKAALIEIASQINHLKSVLRSAGILT